MERGTLAVLRVPRATRRVSRFAAFTLLEMSIVLAIIGVIVAGGMTIFGASMQKRQLQDTQVKLKAIQQALYNFRVSSSRLPCPADVTLALTDSKFGLEAGTLSGTTWVPNSGSCITGGTANANFSNILAPTGTISPGKVTVSSMSSTAGISVGMGVTGTGIPIGDSVAGVSAGAITLTIPATVTANTTETLTIGNNVEGMVPTATLGLSDDYAIDGWGHRIMYVVDNRFTATGALIPYPAAFTLIGTTASLPSASIGFTVTTGISNGMFAYGSGIPTGDAVLNFTSTSVNLATAMASDGPSNVSEPVSFSATEVPGFNILSGDTTPRMTVRDQSGNPKTTTAAYVLISFGPNGHGSYSRDGGTTRLDADSDNADEGKNCDCKVVGTGAGGGQTNGTPPAGTFVQKQPTSDPGDINDVFDDVVVYGTRSDLRGPTE